MKIGVSIGGGVKMMKGRQSVGQEWFLQAEKQNLKGKYKLGR